MKKNANIRLVIVFLCACLFSSMGYAQGDNSMDPLVNLGCLENAIVTGSVPIDQARGIPEDILWDPSKNDYKTVSDYHEYGVAFNDIMAATKEDPLWWAVTWPTAKNINYITCTGTYPNQPQPTTGWAVQIMVDDEWQDLAKAHNGWDADTLSGAGVGIPTQTNWVWDGQLVWRGLEPVVTKGIRFTAYANPDSVADGLKTFADSLWSFVWSGRDFGPGTPKAALIQYLDYSDATADNKLDPLANLALLDEAVVSASFVESTYFNERGQPVDILYNPVKDDYHNITNWGEFGYPYGFEAGYPEGPDDGFIYMIEWPAPKKINYFTWGGSYGSSQPQPETPWAVQYWDGEAWETLINGIGGAFDEGDPLWPYTPGVDDDAHSIWMVPEVDAITTNKFRLAAWSNGFTPLWSFAIRCRGGTVIFTYDDSANPFKAVLVQYAEISDPTTVVSDELKKPIEFALHQNYPNPFNPKTIITYELPITNDVELTIYNLIGQKVTTIVSEKQNAGSYQVEWDASGFASGIYFYRLQTDGGFIQTRKLMFIK